MIPSLFAAAAIALAVPAAPALPAAESARAVDRIRATAAQEKLIIFAVHQMAPGKLVVGTRGDLKKDDFIRRASLVAYAASQAPDAPEEVVFEHVQGTSHQSCRILTRDLTAYLSDRISRVTYYQRLGYESGGLEPVPVPATAVGPTPPRIAVRHPALSVRPTTTPSLPPVPSVSVAIARPHTIPLPVAPEPPVLRPITTVKAVAGVPAEWTGFKTPTLNGDWRLAYGVGLGRGTYDAFQLEYGHTILPALELRPALWILSGFSPLNRMAGATGIEGLSGSLDMVGTTRRASDPNGPALEGGLGLRAATLQSTVGNGVWPAMHLRVGARWNAFTVGMRYPLLARAGDPTSTWEATAGFGWSFGN